MENIISQYRFVFADYLIKNLENHGNLIVLSLIDNSNAKNACPTSW
jgi:hypothetical protein